MFEEGGPIPKTLSQAIYNHIKESIVNNKLKANQKINEKEIAKSFEISTTPVREAVLRLGAEGYVTINSHREAIVKKVSYEELREIFQILGLLDSVGTSLAVDHITAEELKEIERLTRELKEACQPDSIDKFMNINLKIHKKIWNLIPNRFLQATIRFVADQIQRYRYARFYAFRKPGALERSLQEHKEILAALRNKDKRKLKSLLLKNWGSLLQPSSFDEGLKEYLSNIGGENNKEC
jgi:DNA-binding GntR family transcriptional regulator